MSQPRAGHYRRDAAHPASGLAFVLPLLVVYELGVVRLADGGLVVRSGADHWLRDWLTQSGVGFAHAAPAAVVMLLICWVILRRADRPGVKVSTLLGMALESFLGAILLWAVAKNVGPLLERWQPTTLAMHQPPLRDLVTYLGAGIYEEAIFRLGLYGGLVLLLRLIRVPILLAAPAAAVTGAIVFALAHHAGPAGEAYRSGLFLFRVLAGVYFTLVFILRGFGIAVGVHASYDIFVGLELT